jgi:hypothetical protein
MVQYASALMPQAAGAHSSGATVSNQGVNVRNAALKESAMAKFKEGTQIRFQELPAVVAAEDQEGAWNSLSAQTILQYMKVWENSDWIVGVLPNSGRGQQYRVKFVGGVPNSNVIIFQADFDEACLAPVPSPPTEGERELATARANLNRATSSHVSAWNRHIGRKRRDVSADVLAGAAEAVEVAAKRLRELGEKHGTSQDEFRDKFSVEEALASAARSRRKLAEVVRWWQIWK